jgi:hypothetical protein
VKRTPSPRPPLSALSILIATAAALAPAVSQAQAPASGQAVAPGASGQQALAVNVSAQGVTARVCAGGGACSAEGGAALEVAAEARAGLGKARAAVVALADGKKVVRVDVPGAQESERWVMLIAAPLAGKGSDPIVLFRGWTGISKGEHGEGRSAVVMEERLAKGSRVVIGELREDVTICGRPTIVAASEIDPATLTVVKRAAVQNLSPEERGRATKITAARVDAPRPPGAVRLLKATAASSAVEKKFATITDGDFATAWVEAKAGDGRGEFVSMSSAEEVGIAAVDIAIRPESEGAAPKRLFLASTDRVYEVAIPDDAGRKAGGVYQVKLPEEMKTSCLSVVLEEAYAAKGEKSPRVGIGEVVARTSMSEMDPEALVGALAGGGDRARAAAALLARGGPEAVKAAVSGYAKLDDEGKRLAVGVIDAAPCSAQVPFFTGVLAAAAPEERAKKPKDALREESSEVGHALDRLRRCGRAAAPALAELVASGKDKTRVVAAAELSLVAPAEAVPILLDAIPKANEAVRRELRTALAHAAKSDRAKSALAAEMAADAFKARPLVAQVDLLRAVGPRLGGVEGGAQAFASVATAQAEFRTRFLLLAPASALARGGDARATAFLREALTKDADPHVRARAAEVAGAVPSLAAEMVAAVGDPEPRVREGAIAGITRALDAGAAPTPALSPALAARLGSDPWTFVRSGAAAALGALPPGPAADGALAAALADLSPDVRGRALDALGAHKASAYAEPVRERSEDKEENIEVRARAILALAAMCYKDSVEAWTTLARRSVRPLDERDRRLGSAAVAALGIVRPADLKTRLAPLMGKDAPVGVRETAKAALAATGGCR